MDILDSFNFIIEYVHKYLDTEGTVIRVRTHWTHCT